MKEASTRILLDRTVIRLDGRPLFSFGPRIFLTPREKIPGVLAEVAAAGFTTVGTPPASRGNRDVINTIFDEAEKHELLVIVMAEPRVPDPSGFLAEEYRHRRTLHSYCLPTRDSSEESISWFCQERDRLRAKDLFHPIWTPYRPAMPVHRWLEAVDIQSTRHALGGPFPRSAIHDGSRFLAEIAEESARTRMAGRPLFCHSLETCVPDEAREAGAYGSDPAVRLLPARIDEWYPYAADLEENRRRDLMPPDSELLRLRVFELLGGRVRGIITDYFDFLRGPSPFSGSDRFAALARLAQEIAVCHDFFAEGQRIAWEIETGHPRYRGVVVQHSEDYLLLIWHSAPGDEFWIDPASENRLEVILQVPPNLGLQAWQVDFPTVRPLAVDFDLKGAMRVQIDSTDLTAKILLSRSRQRVAEISESVERRGGICARFLVSEIRHRFEKIDFVENELEELGHESLRDSALRDCQRRMARVEGLLETEKIDALWKEAATLLQALRGIIARRMVFALGTAQSEREPAVNLLRHSYYTLPLYYREIDLRDTRAILEFT